MKTLSMDLTKEGAKTIIDTLEIGMYESHEYAAVKFMVAELEMYIKNYSEEA